MFESMKLYKLQADSLDISKLAFTCIINICIFEFLTGDTEVGKTCIMLRYLKNQFSPMYIPTKKAVIGKYDFFPTACELIASQHNVFIFFPNQKL